MIWYAHIITSNIEPTEMGLGKKLWIYPPRNSDLAALRHQDMGDKPDKMEVGVRNLQSPTKEWVNRREASSFSGMGKKTCWNHQSVIQFMLPKESRSGRFGLNQPYELHAPNSELCVTI